MLKPGSIRRVASTDPSESILLILCEGVDCAGKSTLVNRITRVLGGGRHHTTNSSVRVIHRGPPTQHPLREYVEPLLTYQTGRAEHVVCDRWHVGESVYPAIVGRPTQLDAAVNAWIELFLLSRGALVVHVRQTDDYLRDCGVARGDHRREIERIGATTEAFERAVAGSLLPTISLDDGPVSDEDVHDIIEQAAILETRAWPTQVSTTYLGAPRPTLLLVGDRRGVSGDPNDHGVWPAFAPFASTSGYYLLRTLTAHPVSVIEHGHALSTIGLVNANDVDDVDVVWHNADRPPVVALGGQASDRLTKIGVPHRVVSHPQYRRRFHYHAVDAYLHQIFNGLGVAVDA